MYKNKCWDDLTFEEQRYVLQHSKKGPVAYEDIDKGLMPSILYMNNGWAIRCFYTFAFDSKLKIGVEGKEKFFKTIPDLPFSVE